MADGSGYHSPMRWLFLFLGFLTSLVLAEGLPDLGESAQVDFSPQVEKRIGESVMRDIRWRDPAYLDDPEVTAYLNRLGRQLAAQIDGAHQEFEFFAVKDATVNAFAMPGGFIGVHTGLILAAQSESELASVLAHEISHVTQRHLARLVGKQSQGQLAALLSMAVAVLAARSNPDVAIGAAVAGQAVGIQHQLNYSRDFEREADRIGVQLLDRSGYDVRGMAAFFERLQKSGRLYENNAPGYLRTHPLTTERIADMDNRIQSHPYRQVADGIEFQLVKAKLRAQEGAADDAITYFDHLLRERKFATEAAARFGLAHAYLRAKDYKAGEAQLAELRRLKVPSPMLETLAAALRVGQGDRAGATQLLRQAYARHPQARAIVYGLAESLLSAGRPAEALKLASDEILSYTTDARLHGFQAQAYAQLGKRLQQHRAQAEVYVLQGQLLAAIEQLSLAQKAPDGDFYEHSQVDARLRELKARQVEEAKRAKAEGR